MIAEDLGKGRFHLEDHDGKLLKTTINIHRLKLWMDPDSGRLKKDVSLYTAKVAMVKDTNMLNDTHIDLANHLLKSSFMTLKAFGHHF